MGGKIDIQIKHREKVLRLRRLDRLVQSDEFTYIWQRITDKEKRTIELWINWGRYDTLKHWLLDHFNLGFEMYSYKDLRALASKNHVPYYSRKTRAELIKALADKGVIDGNSNRPLNQNETLPSACGCEEGPSGSVNLKTTLKISDDSF